MTEGNQQPGNDELIKTLARDFLADMRGKTLQLRSRSGPPPFDEFSAFGHTLKGTGTMFGYRDLSDLGARLEQKAGLKGAEPLAPVLDEIEKLIDHYLK